MNKNKGLWWIMLMINNPHDLDKVIKEIMGEIHI